MTDRIPTSLSWLVDKRKRTHSLILDLEKKAKYVREIELPKLFLDLEALDRTIKLHEISVDPEKIPPITIYHKRGDIKHGELTRNIYDCLKSADCEGLTIDELTGGIALRLNLDISSAEKYKICARVS